ncbi:ArnT family glycosyltransferase [Thiococcus pfennigii]|uniref:ArnT family glycosyltransferase n=1 Tax=Thiococcus pfennigii TaxID=1057 RepID=UPI00190519E2|nr:glycosyltransferase family 39 protein [Thiococcus pfennigii]
MIRLENRRDAVLVVALTWLLLVLLAFWSRHPMVIDETRYLGVAWEMWLRCDLLVPHLNGEPYSHKPPLLFWLINLSWWLLGVSDWAARLVPALAGLAGALLLMPIARALWPERRGAGPLAAWLAFSTLFWLLWTTVTMFDLLVTVCAEFALLGILLAWRGRQWLGWSMTGAAIGLGILAKGPVILVYALPAAVLAPWWMTEQRTLSWFNWYAGMVSAVLLGVAIGLAWALPAAAAGGADYAARLLWGQTADRMVESFAHRRPFWWYLPLLPLLLFPWSLWSPLWRSIHSRWQGHYDSGERLTLLVFLSGLLIFSLISGKQIHYLLPLFPVLALFAARALVASGEVASNGRLTFWILLAVPAVLGALLMVLPYLEFLHGYAVWIDGLSSLSGWIVLAAVPVALLIRRWVPPATWPGFLTLALVLGMYPGLVREVAKPYAVEDIAAVIRAQQDLGHEVAYVGSYHGEFNFAGRLTRPVQEIGRAASIAWGDANPDGLLVERLDDIPRSASGVLYRRIYRSGYLVIRQARSVDTQGGASAVR